MTFRVAAAALIAAAIAAITPAVAQKKYDPGASDSEIKIGNTGPYSGPASAFGTVGTAMSAYFKMVNDKGGVRGRKINFISLDDGYSPPKTVDQVRRLVEQEQVLMLFSNLGTATSVAIHKYNNAKKVPHVFVASGLHKWSDPQHFPWTIGWVPSYFIEGAIYGRYVRENVPNPKAALLSQNDDAGKEFVAGFKHGLGDKAKAIVVGDVTYESTDGTVDSQVIMLAGSGANVFFNAASPKFAAQAIRKAGDIGWKPVQFLINTAASVQATLQPAGFEKSIGIITAQYLKDPSDPAWSNDPEMNAWRAFMDKYYSNGSKADSFNVYAAAVSASLVHVLEQSGDDLTRANIMRQAASLKDVRVPLLLPGIRLNTTSADFSPIKQVQLAKFNGRNWELFGELISSPK